jgi:hypothetical protein
VKPTAAILAALLLSGASAARAAGTYSVLVNDRYARISDEPVVLDSSWVRTSTWLAESCSTLLRADRGRIAVTGRLVDVATTSLGVLGSFASGASANTDDFLITGPDPWVSEVSGAFHFTLRGDVQLEGGWPGVPGQSGQLQWQLAAGSSGWTGRWVVSSAGAYGEGGLGAATSPDTTVDVTGVFPVGVPFAVSIAVRGEQAVTGNDAVSPMRIVSQAAGELPAPGPFIGSIGAVSGAVMDLPDGYRLDSAEWNVVNNQFTVPEVGVPRPGRAAALALSVLGPNPTPGSVRLRLAVPRGVRAEVEVLDLQGRLVRTLESGAFPAGTLEFEWSGADAAGTPVAPGVYFVVARSTAGSAAARVVRLR